MTHHTQSSVSQALSAVSHTLPAFPCARRTLHTDSSGDASSGKDQALAAAEAAAAAAADAQLRKTADQFGALLANVSDAQRQRYSLAGLGFGLPLSRLHARYFGKY
jgi:hypothetical protein